MARIMVSDVMNARDILLYISQPRNGSTNRNKTFPSTIGYFPIAVDRVIKPEQIVHPLCMQNPIRVFDEGVPYSKLR